MGNCCSSTSSAQQRRPSRQLRRMRQFAAANATEDDNVESQTHESDDCPLNPLSRQELPPQQRHRQLRRQWLLKKSAMSRRSSESSEEQPSEPVASPVSPSSHPLGESGPTHSDSEFIGVIPITILPTTPAKVLAEDMMESTATQVYNFAGTATPVSSKEMLESISTQIYVSATSDQTGQASHTSLFDRGTLDIALGLEGSAQEEFAARVAPSTPSLLNRTRLSLSLGDQKSSSTPKSATTPRSMSTLATSKQVQLPSPTSSSQVTTRPPVSKLPHEILSNLAASNSSRSLRTEFGTQSEATPRSDSFLPRSASLRPPPPALTNWTASASGQASAERDLFSMRSGDATSFSAAALPEARVECAPVAVPLNPTPTEGDATFQRIITWLGGLGHEPKFTQPEESPKSSPIVSRRASRSLSGSHSPTKPRASSRAASPVSSSSAGQGSQAKLEMMAAINTGVLSRSLAIMRMGPDTSLSPSASMTDAPSSDALIDLPSQG